MPKSQPAKLPRSSRSASAVGEESRRRRAGALSLPDYRRYVLPHSAKVFAGVADLGVPRIHFGVGTGELLGLMASAGADVVGVDGSWAQIDAARLAYDQGQTALAAE